jgi:superkiller protein 3
LSQFDQAVQTFKSILKDQPNEFSVSLSLVQTLLSWGSSCIRAGEFSKSIDLLSEALLEAKCLINGKEELSEAWKLIGDACYLGSIVCVAQTSELALIATEILGINDVELDSLHDGNLSVDNCGYIVNKLLRAHVAAMEKMVQFTEGDRLAHSAAYFNLGLARYRLATTQNLETNLASVRPILECFKLAIYHEPRNFEYWNALGVATARHFPSVAEKALSRCLQINERVRYPSVPSHCRTPLLGLILESCTSSMMTTSSLALLFRGVRLVIPKMPLRGWDKLSSRFALTI